MTDTETKVTVTASSTLADGVGAKFSVLVDGVDVGTATADTSVRSYSFPDALAPDVPHDVQVVYTNDTVINGQDRNLALQSVGIGDATTPATSPSEVYTTIDGRVLPSSGVLSWNGTADFQLPGASASAGSTGDTVISGGTLGSGSDALQLDLSQDAFQGNARVDVTVDGTDVTPSGLAITANHAAGDTEAFTLLGNYGAGPHTIGISFLNDAYGGTATTDRNAYIDSVSMSGDAASSESLTAGASRTAGGSVLLAHTGDMGSFQVSGAAEAPPATNPPPVSTPPSTQPVGTTGSSSTAGGTAGQTPSSLPAYYVSATAAAGGNGSQAHPFGTLAQAQSAMEGSAVKTTYVEGGTYMLNSTLTLTSSDAGESFIGLPGQTATITGQLPTLVNLVGANDVTLQNLTLSGAAATPASSGYGALNLSGSSADSIIANHFTDNGGDGISLSSGSSDNVISGNEVDRSGDSSVEVRDGSNGNVVDSNVLNGTSASNTAGGGIFAHGVSGNTFSHNLVENTAGMGIGIEDWGNGQATQNSNNVVTGNRLTNNNTSSTDSGAIYLLGRNDTDSDTTVNMNFISEPDANPAHQQIGIYLDDYASDVNVTNNIVSGSLSFDLQLHGGNDDVFRNNIFDTGSGTTQVGLIQSAPFNVPAGSQGTFNRDTINGNLVVSEHSRPGTPAAYDFIDANTAAVAISNNDYFGGNGANAAPDSSARYTTQGFANQAVGNYALTSGSGAASIGFRQIDQSSIGLSPAGPHYYT